MDNNGFGNNQNNQQQFGNNTNNQNIQQQFGNNMNNQYGQQQFGNNMNNQYGQQQYGNNTNNQNIQQQFNNNMNNQYGQQQYGNNMNNQQQYGNNMNNQYGNMPYNNTNNMNNKNNSNIILMIVGAFLVIVAGVALFVFLGNTKTLTCTGNDSFSGVTVSSKVTAKFKRGKLNKIHLYVKYKTPSDYTSKDIQLAKESVVDSMEKSDDIKNPKVSVKGDTIIVDAEYNTDSFEDEDYDSTKKSFVEQGFTCK